MLFNSKKIKSLLNLKKSILVIFIFVSLRLSMTKYLPIAGRFPAQPVGISKLHRKTG